MALIDLASWKPKSNEFVFAYRYPQTNLSTNTQLIVYESQEALFFSKGKLMGKFGPGKHTLSTENLPLLRNLFGIPFGGKNPFTAEVWIVNKLMPANLSWHFDKMTIHDFDMSVPVPITASGQYGLRVVDSERFLINMVGTKDVFTESDMTSQAEGEFTSKSKSAIMKFMIQQGRGIQFISAYLDELSNFLKESTASFWNTYGLELTKFYVSNVEIDTSTKEGRDIWEALAKHTSMKLTGHTWQQEQAFDLANNTVGQIGNAAGGGQGGLLGSLMALSMMNNMSGNMGGGMIQPQYNQPTFGSQGGGQPAMPQVGQAMGGQQPTAPKTIYCSNCSKKRLSTERFCPHCGTEYNPCPRCGADNSKNAKRCVSCGATLTGVQGGGNICSKCGSPVPAGAAFCSICGTAVPTTNPNVCPRCGSALPPTAAFCPNCGYKR